MMKRRHIPMKRILAYGLTAVLLVFTTAARTQDAKPAKPKDNTPSQELLTRIDFGNTYVTGQTLKSGAIYLLQRKRNEVKSMLTYRENYRKEILESHDIRKQDKEVKGPIPVNGHHE